MYVGVANEMTGIKQGGSEVRYDNAVAERSKIEEQIGLSLATNANLTKIAAKITEKSKVKSYGELDGTGKDKIGSEVDKFGGARAYKERWGTLGASVFAVMNEIEKDSATKSYYSKVQEGNTKNPYFGDPGEKKPEFDEPLASLNWKDVPTNIKTELTDNPDQGPFRKLPASTYDELDFKGKLTLLQGFRYKEDREWEQSTSSSNPLLQDATEAINAYTAAPENERKDKRKVAITAIKQAMKIADDKIQAILGAWLDIVIDRHTSGDHTNLVQRKGDGGVKDQWIEDTVKAGKPIISGPSGHTLRYLNFWAEKRNDEKAREEGNITDWPSLEAARLVMMANLMPARHHSYDEIMTASIGIKDEASDALKYQHKSSYEDLSKDKHKDDKAGEIADAAYKESGAKDADGANTQGIAAAEEAITDQRNAREALQTAKDQLLSKLSEATLKQIQDAKDVLEGIKTVAE